MKLPKPTLTLITASLIFIMFGIWIITRSSEPVHASISNPNAPGRISITFDDGHDSDYQAAAPILRTYGLSGTAYIVPSFIGTSGYMNWQQVHQLQDRYGWEIGSHTMHHRDLSTLSAQQLEGELSDSQHILRQKGFPATEFASPQGDYNAPALAAIARFYGSHRGFRDDDDNDTPYNNYLLYTMHVQVGTPVSAVTAKIDRAIAQHHWLILTFHGIRKHPSSDTHLYDYSSADFSRIAAYVQQKQAAGQLRPVSVAEGRKQSGSNILPGGSFVRGLSSGWSTDTPQTATADAANHGSYPEPQHAIRLTSTSADTHLFAPRLTVRPDQNYIITSYLNVVSITQGEISYYIDDYDTTGLWISGKPVRSEHTIFAENMNFSYKPSSSRVQSARLQITATGSGTTAYVDSVRWMSTNPGDIGSRAHE